MTAPITLTKQLVVATMLVALGVVTYPEIAMAANPTAEGNQSLVFELKPNVLTNNQTENFLTMQEVADNDALVQSVRSYLESKQSPLAPYAHLIVKEPNWQQAMGIVFVESNFCKKAANMNCGSVGVGPKHKQWRKFDNHFEGFQAVTTLLEKPFYKEKYNTCKKKIGVYVVPGSRNWLSGCEAVEKQMNQFIEQAEANRQTKLAFANSASMHTASREIALAQ